MADKAVKTLSEEIPVHDALHSGPAAKPWLWMDVTTSSRARSGQMNGTLRIEQSYAKTLRDMLGSQLRFCRYHRTRRYFLPVDSYSDLSIRPPAARGKDTVRKSSPLRALGRRVERAIRTYRHAAVGGVLQGIRYRNSNSAFAGDCAGEVLLLAGENWTQYDFDVIARLRRERGLRIAALCEDFIPIVCPQFFESGEFVERYRRYADFLIRDADLVIAISASTKSDIMKYASDRGGISGRIEVVQLGADLISVKSARRPSQLSDRQAQRFVLSVSSIQSRKNFDLLYRVWRRLTLQKTPNLPTLVIAGRRGFGSQDLLWQIAHDPGVQDEIAVLHNVSDDELSWLYQNCLWTLYPSIYEGWGLPISESLAYGKYCLASNTSSLPEAGAGLVKHMDPFDFAAWRDAIIDLIGAPEQLEPLETAIQARYRPMTWARSAGILLNELSKLSTARSAIYNG